MKKKVGWILLMPLLAVAVVATAVLILGYLRPQITLVELMKFKILLCGIFFTSVVVTVLAPMAISTIPWFRRRADRWNRGIVGPLPWYVKVCRVIAVLAFFEAFFSFFHSAPVRTEGDKWIVAAGIGHPWRLISETQAAAYLWAGLQAYASLVLSITMLWTLTALALILDNVETFSVEAPTITKEMLERKEVIRENHPIDSQIDQAPAPTLISWRNKTIRVRARLVPRFLWTSSSLDVFLNGQRILRTGGKLKLAGPHSVFFSDAGSKHQIDLNWGQSRNFRIPYQLRIDGLVISDSQAYVENRFMMMVPIIIIIASFFIFFNLFYDKFTTN